MSVLSNTTSFVIQLTETSERTVEEDASRPWNTKVTKQETRQRGGREESDGRGNIHRHVGQEFQESLHRMLASRSHCQTLSLTYKGIAVKIGKGSQCTGQKNIEHIGPLSNVKSFTQKNRMRWSLRDMQKQTFSVWEARQMLHWELQNRSVCNS